MPLEVVRTDLSHSVASASPGTSLLNVRVLLACQNHAFTSHPSRECAQRRALLRSCTPRWPTPDFDDVIARGLLYYFHYAATEDMVKFSYRPKESFVAAGTIVPGCSFNVKHNQAIIREQYYHVCIIINNASYHCHHLAL